MNKVKRVNNRDPNKNMMQNLSEQFKRKNAIKSRHSSNNSSDSEMQGLDNGR